VTDNPSTIDNHDAKNQACQISVSFTGSSNGLENGPGRVGSVYGIGFGVNISGIPGNYFTRSTTNDPTPKGSWIIKQWVADYVFRDGQPARIDPKARMDKLGSVYPPAVRLGDTLSYHDRPGNNQPGNDYLRKSNFYIKAYKGNQHCEVEFHLTFQVYNGQLINPGWGYGVYR
jgi:hypothetical protein